MLHILEDIFTGFPLRDFTLLPGLDIEIVEN